MLEKPDQRLRQRELLLQVSRAITAQLDLTSVLDLVIDVAVDLLAGTVGLIALRDDNGALHVGAGARALAGLQRPAGHAARRSPGAGATAPRSRREHPPAAAPGRRAAAGL